MQLAIDEKVKLINKVEEVLIWLCHEEDIGKVICTDEYCKTLMANEFFQRRLGSEDLGAPIKKKAKLESGDRDALACEYGYEARWGRLGDSVSLLELIQFAKNLINEKAKLFTQGCTSEFPVTATQAITRIDEINAVFLELDADKQRQEINTRENKTVKALQDCADAQEQMSEKLGMQLDKLLKKNEEMLGQLKEIPKSNGFSYDGPSSNAVNHHVTQLGEKLDGLRVEIGKLTAPKEVHKSKGLFGK